jgi:hypothetical protein
MGDIGNVKKISVSASALKYDRHEQRHHIEGHVSLAVGLNSRFVGQEQLSPSEARGLARLLEQGAEEAERLEQQRRDLTENRK